MKYYLLFFLFAISFLSFSQKNTIELTDDELQETSEDVSFDVVEKVPIYKGCNETMTNNALKDCFNEKVNTLIAKNFNTRIAEQLNLPNETIVKISVFFKISKTGEIMDIKVRAPFPELEEEAIRVTNLIPKLKPGYIDGKPVRVPYYLPIKFQVSNIESSENRKPPIYRGCDETSSYEAIKECTTKKIKDYLKVSIDYELADKLFPTDKTTQFLVSFTINKKGKAEKITAKAHKVEMAAEVIRVLKRMPKFKDPAYKNGKAVDTKMEFLMTIHF
ncbi:energy transducer TonB [Xanthomarina sp. F1114]|uniref:energy transducer TonB n=1 Tax=Xanthomarina sp. F1114 TaxID=2996019 RepID=UPI00225DDC9F|nr:energy transducer TonB [Xanthomarina sp. F1114]MCX7546696.1 energy transducer TonB [Xanthomarina sp. F1114]